jgi:RNA polymerase subunit RPABC4/transcription elongation factor Spt4
MQVIDKCRNCGTTDWILEPTYHPILSSTAVCPHCHKPEFSYRDMTTSELNEWRK